jgi:hypothetical protein
MVKINPNQLEWPQSLSGRSALPHVQLLVGGPARRPGFDVGVLRDLFFIKNGHDCVLTSKMLA